MLASSACCAWKIWAIYRIQSSAGHTDTEFSHLVLYFMELRPFYHDCFSYSVGICLTNLVKLNTVAISKQYIYR